MYEAAFGLSRRPFDEGVGPRGPIALPSREAIAEALIAGLARDGGPAALVGPPGSGKTVLARQVARGLRGRALHLAYPALGAAELIGAIADDLAGPAAEPEGRGLAGAVGRLRSALAMAALRGERPTLVVDDAQSIDDPAAFEALRLLLNFSGHGPPQLAMLLVGGPPLALRLTPALADRLVATCVLGPLTEAETATYLDGRLAAAGARRPLFGPEAAALVHRAADGLPRRLNRVADRALRLAWAAGLDRPDARAIDRAAREAGIEPLAAA